jgi:hypothetical protein
MIQILLYSCHIHLVDVEIGHIPVGRDGRFEGGQELLIGLFTHGRRN